MPLGEASGVGAFRRRCPPTPRRSPRSASTPENMFSFWDWVGGRYSVDSAIGLSLMIAIGRERSASSSPASTRSTTTSARRRSRQRPGDDGHGRGLGPQRPRCADQGGHAVRHELAPFPAYLQQLDMERNGKTCTSTARRRPRHRADRVGQPGTNGQHAIYQLLHQGTRSCRSTSSAFADPVHPLGNHHDLLIANLFAQAEALAFGKTPDEVGRRGHPALGRTDRSRATGPRRRSSRQRCRRAARRAVALYEHKVSCRARCGASTRSTNGVSSSARRSRRDHRRAVGLAPGQRPTRHLDHRADRALPHAAALIVAQRAMIRSATMSVGR